MAVKSTIVSAMILSAMACAQDAAPQSAVAAVRLNNQALTLAEEGKYLDAEKLYHSALAVKSGDDLSRAKICNNLAWLYRRQDRYKDAEKELRRALEMRQKKLPPGSIEIAYSFNNLADMFRIEGRDWEARNLLETAVKNLREFHPDAPGLPIVLGNLAVILCQFHEFDQAEKLLRSALSDSERDHGEISREVAIAANNLGQIMRAKNDLKGAAAMYDRAAGILEKLAPKNTSDLATVLANIGQLLSEQHQDGTARKTEERALGLLNGDGDGPLRAAILQNIGNIVAGSGNAAESLPYFEQSLDIQEKTLGPEHPATVRLLFDYSAATSRAGRKSMAHKLRKRAEELLRRLQIQSPDAFTVSLNSLRTER